MRKSLSIVTILIALLLPVGYVTALTLDHPKPIAPPPKEPDFTQMQTVKLPNSTKVSIVDKYGNVIWEGTMEDLQGRKEEVKKIFKVRTGRDW